MQANEVITFVAVLTFDDAVKQSITISVTHNHNKYTEQSLLDQVRDYINSTYNQSDTGASWRFADFEMYSGVQNTMVNNEKKTVIYTIRYYGIDGYYMDTYSYNNNGRDLVRSLLVRQLKDLQ